jgi:hypothetical protein
MLKLLRILSSLHTRHGIDRIKSELSTLTSYLLDYPITFLLSTGMVLAGTKNSFPVGFLR